MFLEGFWYEFGFVLVCIGLFKVEVFNKVGLDWVLGVEGVVVGIVDGD